MKRLGIVVPYRDRKEHLGQFVPHLATYFTRDKVDRDIPIKVVIVEQPPRLPFNRGLINNIGYALVRDEIDYVCFHDVDFLPIWADYSYPELPSMIIWFGMESRPFDPARPEKRIWYRLERCLAAVVLIRNEQFEQANGFSNRYWGWGPEDTDLQRRLEQVGFSTTHRKGTFMPLDHVHQGFDRDGRPTPVQIRNDALYESQWDAPSDAWRREGLCTATFRVTAKQPIPLPDGMRPDIAMTHVMVEFPHTPEKS
jgi:N-terminal domain of galactosyltransferase/N-terminal region of glycosyl transferase group 7